MYQQIINLEEETFKVLANRKRLEILQLLKNRQLSVNEMVKMLGIRQPNLSQHLSLLRQHQLVEVKHRGQKVYYGLSGNMITKAVDMIYRFLQTHHGFAEEFPPASLLFPIVRDPVCGMRLSLSEAFDSINYNERTYHFCASGCRDKYQANPRKYVKDAEEVIKA